MARLHDTDHTEGGEASACESLRNVRLRSRTTRMQGPMLSIPRRRERQHFVPVSTIRSGWVEQRSTWYEIVSGRRRLTAVEALYREWLGLTVAVKPKGIASGFVSVPSLGLHPVHVTCIINQSPKVLHSWLCAFWSGSTLP